MTLNIIHRINILGFKHGEQAWKFLNLQRICSSDVYLISYRWFVTFHLRFSLPSIIQTSCIQVEICHKRQ